MQKRNLQYRRKAILDTLAAEGEVSVDALAQAFATSEVTIRKDLAALEANGLLLRKFGGAVPLGAQHQHSTSSSAQKQAIAHEALGLIDDHMRLLLDSGSTTEALVPLLSQRRGLVVMTNALQAAHLLLQLENEPTLLMTGGTWDAQSHSLQGGKAEAMVEAYEFDLAFVGASGIDPARGTTTFNELRSLSQTMARAAKKVVVLAESDKLQRHSPNVELAWQDVDILITDANFHQAAQQQIQAQGVQVIIAAAANGHGE